MPNNVAITAGSGTTVCTTDITSFSAYSATGQIPAGAIYCSANTSTAPAPVTNANPLPVAVQSSALPSGAATAAKQPALGTAGTSSSDVITVQGISGGVALPVSQSGSWTVTANAGTGTLTTTNASIATSGASVPASVTWVGVRNGTALSGLAGTTTGINGASALYTRYASEGLGQAVSAVSMPVVIASDQTAIPASLDSAAINVGATALTPKFAAIAASTSGNNTVVSAVTGKKIRVLGYRLSANGTVAAKWRSSTAGDISGLSYLIQYASAGASFSPIGHFETASGEGLQLNLDAGVAVGGHLAYIEV